MIEDDSPIDALVKIGNLPSVIRMCEPQVCYPFKLESWMVKRTLKAQELLQQEWRLRNESTPDI